MNKIVVVVVVVVWTLFQAKMAQKPFCGAAHTYMTRKGLLIPLKSRILTKLFNFSLFKSCDLDHWDSDDPIPRDELLKRVSGLDGLYCLLTEKIDAELLDAAGE